VGSLDRLHPRLPITVPVFPSPSLKVLFLLFFFMRSLYKVSGRYKRTGLLTEGSPNCWPTWNLRITSFFSVPCPPISLPFFFIGESCGMEERKSFLPHCSAGCSAALFFFSFLFFYRTPFPALTLPQVGPSPLSSLTRTTAPSYPR